MLSEVPFGAFLAYSPRGGSEVSSRSQAVCRRIKDDGPSSDPSVSMIEYAVRRLRQEAPPALLDLLAPDAALVPVPRSAPFPPRQANVLWVPRRICETLVAYGLGASVLPCLERTREVPKSAFARSGDRPTPRTHLASMRVGSRVVSRPERIVVVDDVVTKGATLLAAASPIHDAFPSSRVSGFALLRTMGLQPEIDRLVDPVAGAIYRTRSGQADRQP